MFLLRGGKCRHSRFSFILVFLLYPDINMVRTISGKLAPLASLGADPIGTLLYERRMSLLWEGHRWNDMRRFGRLSQLPLDCTGTNCGATVHFVARVMPVPKTECDARPADAKPSVGC